MADLKKERDPFAEAKDQYLRGLVRDAKLGEAAVKIAMELTIGFANRREFEATGALVAWPSMRTLSEETGLFKSRIERAIKRLEETGHIAVERPEKRGATHHNRYTLKIQNVRTGADNKKPKKVRTSVDNSKSEKGRTGADNQNSKKVRTGADALSAPVGPKTLDKPLEYGAGALTRHAPNIKAGFLLSGNIVSEDFFDHLNCPDAPDDMSEGQAFEKPSPALSRNSAAGLSDPASGHEAEPEFAPEPSFEPAPEYGTDWDDDEIEEPSDFEIAVGDLVRLLGDRDIALSLADDLVDGFAGRDRLAAQNAIQVASKILTARKVEWDKFCDIVADIGASAGRGEVVGKAILSEFERHLTAFRAKPQGAAEQVEREISHV